MGFVRYQVSMERGCRVFACGGGIWVPAGVTWSVSELEPLSPSFLSDFQGVLATRSPLQTVHHSTVHTIFREATGGFVVDSFRTGPP
jgi:hypothetical protein